VPYKGEKMDKVVHFEIPAGKTDRAAKFYQRVFGWQIKKVPEMDYWIVTTVRTDKRMMPAEPGAINGGLMQRNSSTEQPVIVISVRSLDSSLKLAQKHGAKLAMKKQTVMGMGYYARIKDTEGNVIGVWQNIKKQ